MHSDRGVFSLLAVHSDPVGPRHGDTQWLRADAETVAIVALGRDSLLVRSWAEKLPRLASFL